MIHYYLDALYRSWDDQGKASREEFGFFLLWHVVFSVVLYGVDFFTHWKLLSVYIAATLVQTIVLFVRRLHDTGRSGWWFILVCLPIIGWLLLIYFLVQKSHSFVNSQKK